MITLNKNTNRAQALIHNYEYANKQGYKYYSVENFYKNPSYNKLKAWRYCQELCKNNNGYNLLVCGGNSSFFSAGFTMEEDNKKYLIYITASNDYKIELD